MTNKVYISGMNSGQNPSAGLGIARCLRKAFSNLTLVGVDHWQGSSGLHDAILDETLIFPRWDQISKERYVSQLRTILDNGHIWIPALDVEVYWLAQNFGTHPNLLSPGGAALQGTAKPYVKGFESLGFGVAESLSAYASDEEVHCFLRANSWRCWLKGPFHDAKRIGSWEHFLRARGDMERDWKTSRLFLQKHIFGTEESICFSAVNGEMVTAIHMEKRLITGEGKTWAGGVKTLDPEISARLKAALAEMNWSGGGEIEYTRDPDGKKWIIECNPRYPAWIFGAATTGVNLPGRMLSRAWNLGLIEPKSPFPYFTRVVQEIPVKEPIGLPRTLDPSMNPWPVGGGKGKGGPTYTYSLPPLRDNMDFRREPAEADEEDLVKDTSPQPPSDPYSKEVDAVTTAFKGETPSRLMLEDWISYRFQSLLDRLKVANAKSPHIRIGYSIKTSPTEHQIRLARNSGFYMECISQMEIRRALELGAQPKDVILNGPGKFWPLTTEPIPGLHMLFCDSIEEFERVIEMPNVAECVGLRIRLPQLPSRFGIPVEDYETFQRILKSVRKLKKGTPLGFHFHMPSWNIGVKRWTGALQAIATWSKTVEDLTGTKVRRLDLGGGFFPADLASLNLSWVQKAVRDILPNVEAIYFEPGRSLTQEGEILVSRVLNVSKGSDEKEPCEVVVDACIAELPLISSYPHRMFFRPKGPEEHGASQAVNSCLVLGKGKTKILGRICMENDVLSDGINLPPDIKIGDYVIFGDAGAYERTMSYDFGRG
jgi:diaminopimelate decarboxylase